MVPLSFLRPALEVFFLHHDQWAVPHLPGKVLEWQRKCFVFILVSVRTFHAHPVQPVRVHPVALCLTTEGDSLCEDESLQERLRAGRESAALLRPSHVQPVHQCE